MPMYDSAIEIVARGHRSACCSRLRSPAAACCPNAGKDETAGWSADQLYREAHDALLQGNYTRATKLFESLEARYPYGRYAQQAILESRVRQLARRRAGRRHRRRATASSARIPIIRTSTTRTT